MATRKKKTQPPAEAAVARAWTGDWQPALTELLTLSEQGDVTASAALVTFLGACGRWRDVTEQARRFFPSPDAVAPGNVFIEACGVARRAVEVLDEPDLLGELAALVPASHEDFRDASLLDWPRREPEARAPYEKAVAEAPKLPRFKKSPDQLPRHLFALACVFRVDDEIIARYDAKAPWATFDVALDAAKALARKGRAKDAWAVLEPRLGDWLPVGALQVLCAELLTDDALFALMTPARFTQVLSTRRGPR